MIKIDVAFIVLHYGDVNLTISTINSLIILDDIKKCEIIVVDNGTKTGEVEIKNQFINHKNLHILKHEKNCGFSKGNNSGYKFIKSNFNPDFVIAVNNDIIFSQTDFINKLYECYNKSGFYIAGPDICIPKRKLHSNPMKIGIVSIDEMEKRIKNTQYKINKLNKAISAYGFKSYIRLKCKYIDRFLIALQERKKSKSYFWHDKDIVLQGSCIIFSNKYIEINSNLFEPEVFLFCEEHFLALKCKKMNWKIDYLPELSVLHLHKASSNLDDMSYKDYCAKRIELEKHQLVSQIAYVSYAKTL